MTTRMIEGEAAMREQFIARVDAAYTAQQAAYAALLASGERGTCPHCGQNMPITGLPGFPDWVAAMTALDDLAAEAVVREYVPLAGAVVAWMLQPGTFAHHVLRTARRLGLPLPADALGVMPIGSHWRKEGQA